MTRERQPPTVAVVGLAILTLGATAALLTLAWPGPALALFPRDPQPTLTGTPAEAADILLTNLSVLAVPLLFAGAAGGRPGPWCAAGDLATAGLVAINSLGVGAALALHGTDLLPYLPHLPLEAAALALSATAWITHRDRADRPWTFAIAVAVLASVAAALEVIATPHLPRWPST